MYQVAMHITLNRTTAKSINKMNIKKSDKVRKPYHFYIVGVIFYNNLTIGIVLVILLS